MTIPLDTNKTTPRLLDVPETIKRTCLGKTKLYEIIYARELRPIKLGRKTVFSEQEVSQWIENQIAKRGD